MGLTKHERAEIRQRAKEALDRYAATHSEAELKRHIAAQRYPSGRWSHGGANRSSSLRREIAKSTTTIRLCVTCGGVSDEVATLTELFPTCTCLVQPI